MRTYEMEDFQNFLDSWVNKTPSNRDTSMDTSEYKSSGRVCSDISSASGPVLSPSDPNFWDVIETGVERLVKVIIESYGLITFCSCEGHEHLSREGKYIDDRFVKILFLNDRDFHFFWAILHKIKKDLWVISTNVGFDFKLYKERFFLEKQKIDKILPCCQIYFPSKWYEIKEYYAEVDSVCNTITDLLGSFATIYKNSWKV